MNVSKLFPINEDEAFFYNLGSVKLPTFVSPFRKLVSRSGETLEVKVATLLVEVSVFKMLFFLFWPGIGLNYL